jgi:predicted transcriptional regulator
MADSGVLSIRLPKEQLQRLDALAQSTKRSPSLLAAEAVAGYLAAQEWQIEAAEAGVAAAKRGEVVPPPTK